MLVLLLSFLGQPYLQLPEPIAEVRFTAPDKGSTALRGE